VSGIRQDGQMLWAGILSAQPELLASMLALLEQTTFFNVIGKKGKSLVRRDGDEFAKALEAQTLELSQLEHDELILQLLGKLEEIAGVQPGYLAGRRDIEDLCGELTNQAVALKQQGDKDFVGDSLLDLVSWIMQEILTQIEEKFETLDDEKQEAVVTQLREHLSGLPVKQQQAIKDALKVDALTNDVLRQAIVKGSLGLGFSAAVSMGGFAFYAGASSMLAGLAGLVGLTLPFAAYTTMSSAIAVIASPIAIVFVVLGTLAAGWWKGNQKIRQTLYPLVVVQLAAAKNVNPVSENSQETESLVLGRWREAVSAALKQRSDLERLTDRQIRCEEQLQTAKNRLVNLKKTHKKNAEVIKKSWSELYDAALENGQGISKGEWGSAYKAYGRRIVEAQKQSSRSTNASRQKSLFGRIADVIKDGYQQGKAGVKSSAAARDLIDTMKDGMPRRVISDPEVEALLDTVRKASDRVESIEEKIDTAIEQVERRSEKLELVKEKVADRQAQLEEIESQYFGLAKAVDDWPEVAELPKWAGADSRRLEIALESPLVPQAEEQRLRSLLQGSRGNGAFAGLVLGDFLYDYLRIDPLVMEGIDFARAADLSNPLLFAEFASKQASLMVAGEGDSIDRLQGYVAERVVAQHLAAEGYDVSFPEHSNQPGWDLLVDGQAFQVKCTESAAHIQKHLDMYPDIPIIVNVEHAGRFDSVPQVYIEPALSVSEVDSITRAGIADGADLADFELPWIALAVATAVELRDLSRHRTGYAEAITNIATSTVGRAAGGGLGAATGSVLGSFLFGPAGSVIGGLGGAVGGGIGGGWIARTARGVLVSEESDEVRTAARNLAQQAAKLVPRKVGVWKEKRAVIARLDLANEGNQRDADQIRKWLLSRLDADVRYFEQRGRELAQLAAKTDDSDPSELVDRVLNRVRQAAIHPHHLQTALGELFEALNRLGSASARYRIAVPGTGNPAA
jgi:uncharacterized protein YcfJ